MRDLPAPAYQCAYHWNLAELESVVEAYASYETVGIQLSDVITHLDEVEWCRRLAQALSNQAREWLPKMHRIPVQYEAGEGLREVATLLGISSADLIASHSRETYQCAAVGFCPGFAYLGPLPPQIQGVARLKSPRQKVSPGSVAITGNQTAIYPLETPGGWRIIGKTPLVLVDVADQYFPISAGDYVCFDPIELAEFKSLEGTRL